MLIDTNDKKLAEIGSGMNAYISDHDGVIAVKEDLSTELNNRLDDNDGNEAWIVQFADFKDFCERSNLEDTEISILIDQGVRVGIHLILCSDYNYIGQSFEQIPKYVRNQSTVGLVSMRLGDQDIFKQPFMRQEKYPGPFECYFAMDHQHVKIKIPE